MKPNLLAPNACQWPGSSFPAGLLGSSKNGDDEDRLLQNYNQKIQRHFMRLGFAQAGSKEMERVAWFLTAGTYFGGCSNKNQANSIGRKDPSSSWRSKSEVERIKIHVKPKIAALSDLNKELRRTVAAFPDAEMPKTAPWKKTDPRPLSVQQTEAVRQLQDLVQRGASVNTARGLHMAASTNRSESMLFETLIRLGGDLNLADELDFTPLHIAAGLQRANTVEILCRLGANRTLRNSDGLTPLETFRKREQTQSDYTGTYGLDVMLDERKAKRRCLNALMSEEQEKKSTDQS